MLRANRNQLEELRALCGDIQTKSARHGVYIVCDRERAEQYRRILRGDLSNRQQNKLRWHYKKRQ